MMMSIFVLASAVGAIARFGCERLSVRLLGERFPWGTLTANVLGSFILGVSIAWPDESTQIIAAQAFCGAFTTFGGFIGQSWSRLRHRESTNLGWTYLLITVVSSIAAAGAGMALAN